MGLATAAAQRRLQRKHGLHQFTIGW